MTKNELQHAWELARGNALALSRVATDMETVATRARSAADFAEWQQRNAGEACLAQRGVPVTHTEAVAAWAAMSTEQRDAMACAAPNCAGPWEQVAADFWIRGGPLETPGVSVMLRDGVFAARGEITRWKIDTLGQFTSLELAQAACDAALRAAGWALEP